ncbi:MAG TPA: RES family NAD+ phosphorylase [Spirillospora sp.]|nr:RES family NAD+ phosphorylase [Spirillospora sp.]
MPPAPPPVTARSTPTATVLEAGTRLWRVHRRTRAATDFKAVPSDGQFGGGRFDGTRDDPYPFWYAALHAETALLEALVRGIPFDHRGVRYLRRAALAELAISAVDVAADLKLISLLTTADLAASCQDEWLIHADPPQYPQTRRWGHWLRERAPWGQGLVWPSRRDIGRPTTLLFGDRVPAEALASVPEATVALDDAAGARWLNERLAPYRVQVKAPRARG